SKAVIGRKAFTGKKKAASKEARRRVLIACEDSKTSVNYFKALCKDLRLTDEEVVICGECGSAPKSVYAYARQEGTEGEYDKAYCVFDKDDHKDYASTLGNIRSNHGKGDVVAVPSVPCFELWALLHFEESARPDDAKTPI